MYDLNSNFKFIQLILLSYCRFCHCVGDPSKQMFGRTNRIFVKVKGQLFALCGSSDVTHSSFRHFTTTRSRISGRGVQLAGQSTFRRQRECQQFHHWTNPFTKPNSFQRKRYSSKSAALQHRIDTLPKGNLETMELDKSLMEKVITPEVEVLAKLFEKNNYELRLAGGPVRDLLMGKIPDDLDFATTATPDQMKAMFEAEGIRMINTKGEKHGTITARINDKDNFEVTTLRIDVVTDGRHAEVAFTTNWEVDAARRDLTVNSMFLDLSGTVYDYFQGAKDLSVRRVRFVGDPEQRIQEDYLRILRYFRFYGRLSNARDTHEEETLSAIKKNIQGLQRISGERIWMELKKILIGNYSKELVLRMLDLGIGQYIGLPLEPDVEEFKSLCKRLSRLELSVNPISKLTALLRTEKEGIDLNARLKLSAFERDLCLFLILHRKTVPMQNSIREFQRILVFTKNKISDVRFWSEEVLKYTGSTDLLREYQNWELPKFPVRGNVLVEMKVPGGRPMTQVLNELKELWIESNFTLSADELIKEIPQILEDVKSKMKVKVKK